MQKKILPFIVISLLLSACNNHQTAGDRNFKQALNKYNQQHPECRTIPLINEDNSNISLGNDVIRISRTDSAGNKINQKALKQMQLLKKAGIYKQNKDDASSDGKVSVAVFVLNKDAKNKYKSKQLCIGTIKVKEIKWFSQPTNDKGLVVSKVAYAGEYQLYKWSERLLKETQPDMYDKLKQPVNAQSTLVLTNKGWLDIREVN
ncbi:MAG: hypothetical protein IK065_02765 [Neisseriaceae bacterium]|nr:hypothetical protein [Neisseriaceae bacterium]